MPDGGVVLFCFGQCSLIRQRTEPAEQLTVHLLSTLRIFAIERTALLALLATQWRSVLLLRICAPLTFVTDERGDQVAILTGGGLVKRAR